MTVDAAYRMVNSKNTNHTFVAIHSISVNLTCLVEVGWLDGLVTST